MDSLLIRGSLVALLSLCALVVRADDFALTDIHANGYSQQSPAPVARGIIDDSVLLGAYFQILEDPGGQLSLNDILYHPEQYPFTPANSPVSQLGNRESVFWIKLNYELPKIDSQWVISIEYPHLKEIVVYAEFDSGYRKLTTTGYSATDNYNAPDVQGFGFFLPQRSGENTLYMKISSDSPLIVPAYLHTLKTVLAHEKTNNQFRGIFYGIFFVMSAFNLFIFFTTRNVSYIYYVLYIGSIFVYTLSNDGVLREFLQSNFGSLQSYGAHMLTPLPPIIFGSLFCQHILYTKEKLPVFHKIINGAIVASLVIGFIILVFGSHIIPRAVMLLTLAFAFIAISAGIAGLFKNIPTARFFCIAWAAVIAGSFTWIFTLLDIFPYNQFSKFALHLGAAIETILLSMALGDRIRVLEQERLSLEKQAKAQLEDSNRKLAASNKFKDEFLSVISHELRTPMNGIFGATELLRFTHPNEEQTSYIDTVINSSKDMLKMVEDILTYTQCEANTLKENKVTFNLHQLLDSLAQEYRMRCEKNGVNFEFKIDGAAPSNVYADKNKIKLVLQHVLDNAWKFTDHGIVIFSCNVINDIRDKVDLEFIIKDTGCGVAEELKDTIFESFRQADGSLTRKKGGLGIGLALSNDIISILHGQLKFDSKENVGTTVTITLSIEKSEAKGGSIHHDRQAAFPKLKPGKRILVVEDNPVNKLVLVSLMKKLGLKVDSAINGKEALDYLLEHEVDLVLMDCQMPVMDGFEATRYIRKLENKNHKVPIIAVTANANPGDKLLCLEAGMNDYIKKPISQNLLIDKMANWLH